MYALVDCNNFYASCERVFKPHLKNIPVIVLSNNDGCVIARSNEAKKLGIGMGVPAFKLNNIIENNNVKVFSTNFALYGDMSSRVMNTLSNIIPQLEIYSIDEAFLDFSDFKYNHLFDIGLLIRNRILKNVGIPVSVGIERTKTLSKIAGEIAKKTKKNGVFILHENNENAILNEFDIKKIWGVGNRLNIFFRKYGIKTGRELRDTDINWVQKKINVTARKMIEELRGIPHFNIQSEIKNKKSICTSRTFGTMISDKEKIKSCLAMYTARCAEKLRIQNSSAASAHIFLSTNPYRNDLKQYSNFKSIRFSVPTNNTGEMISCILNEFDNIYKNGYLYKKAGVVLSGIIENSSVQCNIFDKVDRLKSDSLMNAIDGINKKMGRDIVRSASQGYSKGLMLKQANLSRCYTTRWTDLLVANADKIE